MRVKKHLCYSKYCSNNTIYLIYMIVPWSILVYFCRAAPTQIIRSWRGKRSQTRDGSFRSKSPNKYVDGCDVLHCSIDKLQLLAKPLSGDAREKGTIVKHFQIIIITCITQCFIPLSVPHNTMHSMYNLGKDLIVINLLIFSHTLLYFLEHFVGINRMSADEHCKLRQEPITLKWTEKEINQGMNYASCVNVWTHHSISYK